MPNIEELQNQIEELRVRVAALAKGVGLQIGARGFKVGKLRLFHRNVSSGDDRLYQEESDGTQTDLTTAGSGGTRIQDADADTKVQVEKTADDDTWRVDCKGNEELKCTDTQFTCTPNADFAAGVDVTGNVTVTGTVDTVDIAARDHAQAHGPSDHTEGNAWKMVYQDASGDEAEIAVGADGTILTGTGASGAPAFQAASEHAHANDHAQAHGPTDHTGFANWKVIYTDASGDQQEVAVGADGTVFTGTGAASAPAFEAADEHAHSNDHAQAHGPTDHTGFANWKVIYTDASGDQQEVALGADGTFFQSGGAATLPEFTALAVADIPYDDGTSDPLATADAAADGTESSPARKDHVHPLGGTAGGDLGGTYPNPTVDDGADSTAIHDNVANEITAIATKATPVAADELVIEDSAASFVKKAVTFAAFEGALTHDSLVSGTIADHDTGATGAELDTLTDGSTAGGLHVHVEAEITDLDHLTGAEAISAVEGEATLDLTGDVTIATGKSLTLEKLEVEDIDATPIDDVLLKVINAVLEVRTDADDAYSAVKCLKVITNDIQEQTGGSGVTLDGVTCKDDAVEVDAIRGLKESGGQALDMGAVADGQFLKRDGTDIVGAAGGGGQDLETDTLWAADGDMVIGTGDDGAEILSADTEGNFLRLDATPEPYWDTPGLADTNPIVVDATDGAPNDDEYARWTATGLEGRTEAQFKSDFNLEDADINTLAVAAVATADPYLKNDASDTTSGVLTADTLEATGDTSAGDNSALGYTATEGAILTGQGSTSDVTIKNDADGTVISIPTGTTTTRIASDIVMPERADHETTAAAGIGLLWTKNTAPSTLIYTDDAGTDTTLGAGGGGGATTALDNLASVAINTSLLSDADSTDDLGSAAKYWKDTYTDKLYLNATATLDGSTGGRVTLTGYVKAISTVGIYDTNPTSGKWVNMAPSSKTWSAAQTGIVITPASCVFDTSSRAFTGVFGSPYIYADDGVTNIALTGLDYAAGAIVAANETGSYSAVIGVRTGIAAIAYGGSTLNVTDGYGVYVYAPSLVAIGTIDMTDYFGIYMEASGDSSITNAYGLYVGDVTGATSTNYIAWFGDATPQVRIDGGAYAVANKTACVFNIDGTQYRLINDAGTAKFEAI